MNRFCCIPSATTDLWGELQVPRATHGLILLASDGRPAYPALGEGLRAAGWATVLVNLNPYEQSELGMGPLSDRLVDAMRWIRRQAETQDLPLALLGTGSAAGAALVAASREPARITCVISQGGRPDLAGNCLAEVRSPTLLLVEDTNPETLRLNQATGRSLAAPWRLAVVPRLQVAVRLACEWFAQNLLESGPLAGAV